MVKKDFITWIKQQIEYYKSVLGLKLRSITVRGGVGGYVSIRFTYQYINIILEFSNKAYKDLVLKDLKKDSILCELCNMVIESLHIKAVDGYIGQSELEDERKNIVDNVSAIIRRLDR